MTNKSELKNQIVELNDSNLIEATSYYLSSILNLNSLQDAENQIRNICEENQADYDSLTSLRQLLESDRASHRKMLQFVLLDAVETENQLDLVQKAVESVGEKQIVQEIVLAITLGTLATMLLIEKTQGKKRETKHETYKIKPDGTVIFEVTEETIYVDAGSPLGKLFDFFKNIPWSGD